MGVVVHGVDAPVIAGAVMLGMTDAVQHGIAHIHVGRRHVNLGPQHVGAIGKLAGPHPAEQVKAFLDRAVAMRAFLARLGQCAAILPHFVGGQAVHVSVAVPYHLLRVLVEFLEIIRGVIQVLAPVEPQPFDICQYGLHVLDVFAGRVGIVKAHMAAGAVVLLSHAEVEADGLGVPDVQVPVGFGRKTGHHPAVVGAGGLVFVDDGTDEVGGKVCGCRVLV